MSAMGVARLERAVAAVLLSSAALAVLLALAASSWGKDP